MRTSTTTFFPQNKSIFRSYVTPQICGMEEQTIAFTTKTALCMHRGQGSPLCPRSFLLLFFPEYTCHFSQWCNSIQMDGKALTGTTYPFQASRRRLITQTIFLLPIWLGWNHYNQARMLNNILKPGFPQSYHPSWGLSGSASLPHWNNPGIFLLPLIFSSKPNKNYSSFQADICEMNSMILNSSPSLSMSEICF